MYQTTTNPSCTKLLPTSHILDTPFASPALGPSMSAQKAGPGVHAICRSKIAKRACALTLPRFDDYHTHHHVANRSATPPVCTRELPLIPHYPLYDGKSLSILSRAQNELDHSSTCQEAYAHMTSACTSSGYRAALRQHLGFNHGTMFHVQHF